MPYVCGVGPFLLQARDDGPLTLHPISQNKKDHISVAFRDIPFNLNKTDELEYWPLRIEVEVVGEDMFGDANDIPVYLVKFVDSEVKDRLYHYHDLVEFRTPTQYLHYNGPPAPLARPFRPHITRKHLTGPLQVGARLLASRIFIKKVDYDGPPLYERQLNPEPQK